MIEALNAAATKLRKLSLAHAEGAFLGSEDDVLSGLGMARTPLKQAARLIEREGLLRVKRGVGGGYYRRNRIENVPSATSPRSDTTRVLADTDRKSPRQART